MAQSRKYRSKKCTYNDIDFDSTLERDYYIYLKNNKEKLGICDIQLQVPFILQEKCRVNGKALREIKYTCDFLLAYLDGHEEVIDTKGSKFNCTNEFKLKWKMLKFKHRDEYIYRIVSKKKGEFIDI